MVVDVVLSWSQIAGAVAGGIVGGFSGFCANTLQQRGHRRREQRNVASALSGEIQALNIYLSRAYMLPPDTEVGVEAIDFGFHRHFRAERDYCPIFRSLGSSIGLLDTPLPRDLAHWYTGFAVVLERARELYALSSRPGDEEELPIVARLQHKAVCELTRGALDLLGRLAAL
jgi:hypothetical protein